MSYLPMGDIASSEFNSSKYPGVCKPSTVAALGTFKRLQTQLNRVAAAKGIATIAIDGDIGPGTLGIFGKVQTQLIAYATANMDLSAAAKIATALPSSCASVAMMADVIANIADSYADELKAPANPPAPKPIKPPMLVSSTGIEMPPPAGAELLTAWTSASTTTKLAAVGVLAGVAYVAFGMNKKRKRR